MRKWQIIPELTPFAILSISTDISYRYSDIEESRAISRQPLYVTTKLLTTELPDDQPQRAMIIKPITTYESNSYQEDNDYNKDDDRLAGV